jgi:hypothetical protein
MHGWTSSKATTAPIGALSFLAIGLTAACFPVMRVVGHSAWWPLSAVVVIMSGVLFSPAMICSGYSIVCEKSKLFGSAGLLLAGLTLVTERETLYFLEMGLFLVPCTLLVMMAVAKYRRKENRPADLSAANG